MTTPNTPHRFIAGAIDLGEVKAKAEARAQANPGGTRTGVAVALTLTMENVEDELLKRSAQVPVIVLIGTPRSEDSNRLRTDFTDLAEAGHYSFVFRYADADATPDIARMFGVQGLPTVVAIAAGQPIANFAGGQPKEALTQWVAAVKDAVAGQLTGIPAEELAGAADNEAAEPEDPRFIPAEKAMAEGDYAAAISVYEGILAQDPKNAAARAASAGERATPRRSQRKLTYGMPQRAAASPTASEALRLVPTNITLPPLATTVPTKFSASFNIGTVFSRLIMWMSPRLP